MVMRRKAYYYCSRLLLGAGTLSYVTSFVLFGDRFTAASQQQQHHRPLFSSAQQQHPDRSYETPADIYFQEHHEIPKPKSMHTVLLPPIDTEGAKSILIVGDVHGCLHELQLLHELAVQENSNQPFQYVILVGDLVNKGPSSAQVIKYVQSQSNWLSVRGNHDLGALAAALGHETRRQQPKYASWIQGLTDQDVQWLADLPYTIRIPATYWNEHSSNLDTEDAENRTKYTTTDDMLIVHAGLIPGKPLKDQTIDTMVTVRKVPTSSGNLPWATVWRGPEHVIFGHDARRGLQQESHATGLDTGVCYGKQLTAILLPRRQFVSVDARESYSPIATPR